MQFEKEFKVFLWRGHKSFLTYVSQYCLVVPIFSFANCCLSLLVLVMSESCGIHTRRVGDKGTGDRREWVVRLSRFGPGSSKRA